MEIKEICICAAIVCDGKVWRGNRHNHAIMAMNDELSYNLSRRELSKLKVDQGFITSSNCFVNRKEGLKLQLKAGVKSVRGEYQNQLYSEDLY